MEKKLVKTGIYSFVLSLLVGLLLFKGSQTYYHDSNFSSTVYDSLTEYIVKLLRFSAIVTLLSLIVAGLDRHNELITNAQHKLSVVKLACVMLCIGIAAYWIIIGVYTQ